MNVMITRVEKGQQRSPSSLHVKWSDKSWTADAKVIREERYVCEPTPF